MISKAVATALLLSLLVSIADAQSIKAGGLTGKVVSASVANVSVASTANPPAVIFTTPAAGHFVLTQVGSALTGDVSSCCAELTFSASNFGPLATVFAETRPTSSASTIFLLGIALPAGSAISCEALCATSCGVNPTDCSVTGVLEK